VIPGAFASETTKILHDPRAGVLDAARGAHSSHAIRHRHEQGSNWREADVLQREIAAIRNSPAATRITGSHLHAR
jgi:hypothetical protein